VIVSCVIEEPLEGAWVADVVSTHELTNGTIVVGGSTWVGTLVAPSAADGGRWVTRIVGGAGKLGVALSELSYGATLAAKSVVEGICQAAGETLEPVTVTSRVASWTRKNGTAGQTLREIADAVKMQWWVARDGRVNFGARSTVASLATGMALLSRDIDCEIFSAESCVLVPGMTFGGRAVKALRWQLNSSKLVATVYYTALPALPDISQFFAATHSAKVVSQNANGSLELIVDGRFSMSRVPLMVGLPTAKVELVEGDEVVVGFYARNPQLPYAMCTQQGGGTKAVATVGSEGDAGTIQYTPGSPGALIYTPPATEANPIPTPVTAAGQPIPIQVVITTGIDRIKLG
jgi:hypothetical protein